MARIFARGEEGCVFLLTDTSARHVARLHTDGEWAIRDWLILLEASLQPHPDGSAKSEQQGWALCRVLVAARDNFREKRWAESDRLVAAHRADYIL